jgi:Co/Zn/Cd efflux system component
VPDEGRKNSPLSGFKNKPKNPTKQIKQQVLALEGVLNYSNPHFWVHTSDNIVGTLNVEINETAVEQKVLQQVCKIFRKKGVKNLTVQINITPRIGSFYNNDQAFPYLIHTPQ